MIGLNSCLFYQLIGLLPSVFHLSDLPLHQFGLLSRFPLSPHDVPLLSHLVSLSPHLTRLASVNEPLQEHDYQLKERKDSERSCKPYEFPLNVPVFLVCLLVICGCCVAMFGGASLGFRFNGRLRRNWRGLCGCAIISLSWFFASCAISAVAFGSPFALWQLRWLLGEDEHCNYQPFHSGKTVTQQFPVRDGLGVIVVFVRTAYKGSLGISKRKTETHASLIVRDVWSDSAQRMLVNHLEVKNRQLWRGREFFSHFSITAFDFVEKHPRFQKLNGLISESFSRHQECDWRHMLRAVLWNTGKLTNVPTVSEWIRSTLRTAANV